MEIVRIVVYFLVVVYGPGRSTQECPFWNHTPVRKLMGFQGFAPTGHWRNGWLGWEVK